MQTAPAKGKILIVDDDIDMIRLLSLYLTNAGFEIIGLQSGTEAISRIEEINPDIVLLDILMPELDGFETCHQLKTNPVTANFPVIFLTALADTHSKVKGFKIGAVDYITKPSQSQEVVARVNTHLTMRRLQRDMQEQNERLQEENLKRRRVQDALRESRERYRLLAENSTDMISRQTPDGIYRYVSPACRGLLGYDIEEMVGKKETDFIDPIDLPLPHATNGHIEEREPVVKYIYRARRKDGQTIWLETTSRLVRDPDSELPLEIIAVSRNVTDRKEAEEALQRAHDELEQRVLERTAELVKLNAALGRFVPHEFLQFLGKASIVDVVLGDQVQRDMTVFFSDIRSFTTLSEQMNPEENFTFINDYLSRVSPIIRKNHGFIDKYIGDAVMALFPNEVEDALTAAIGIQQELSQFNRERQARGQEPISVGTGIHTGSLMLGTIGEQLRMEGTVISDNVNLAFRLEGLTKLYGASIVISQYSLFSLNQPNRYRYRFLDRVRVKGKAEPVSVFEIFEGDPQETIDLKQKTLTHFEKGLLHYHSREFDAAKARFARVIAANPADKAADLYLKRSEHFARYGVPPDWEGITALTEK
ncbi:MAG: Chemotaxis response regulator protein-glutamate methylesterase [Anaerolineae bacterium]|nr:Chemotaxis response regulator protein-glutamate methylesterase [Anaerolineae bacterium]